MSSDLKDPVSKQVSEIPDKSEKEAVKRKSEGIEEVQSANDWEHANLGDDGRKNKFLRLMGASKKEHHGKFLIGDTEAHKTARPVEAASEITDKLEHQYNESLEFKLSGNARRHKGLGFSQPENEGSEQKLDKTDSESKNSPAAEAEAGESVSPDSSKMKEIRVDSKTNDGPAPPKKQMLMNFVKSSS